MAPAWLLCCGSGVEVLIAEDDFVVLAAPEELVAVPLGFVVEILPLSMKTPLP